MQLWKKSGGFQEKVEVELADLDSADIAAAALVEAPLYRKARN